MKFGQLIQYNKRNVFFKIHAENVAGRLAPDLFLFYKKAVYEVKASVCSWISLYFDSLQLGIQ